MVKILFEYEEGKDPIGEYEGTRVGILGGLACLYQQCIDDGISDKDTIIETLSAFLEDKEK